MNNAFLIILISLWRTLVLLPRWLQLILSSFIGLLFYLIPIKRNKYSKINIDLCFPNKTPEARKDIFKRNVISSGQVFFDTGIAWFWNNKRIKRNISYEINGLSNLLKDQASDKGILLFFKHSLHLELDSRILGMHAEIYGVEREHNSKYFQSIQRKGRLKSMLDVVDRKNTIRFIKWLKDGKTVLYAPDQDYGMKKSNEIKFFNHPAATVSAPFKIIQKTNCKTYFLNSYFKKHKLFIDIEELTFNDTEEIGFSKNLNSYIEAKIKLNPHEYLWQHRRFKSTLGKNKIYK
jgi:lauroyl/myristoyl acyltransferase